MSAIPLYLQSNSTTLALDAAERLRIQSRDKPERRLPLHLVSRIICTSATAIDGRVIITCMQRGIPIIITDKNGIALGWCLGWRRRESSLQQLLQHALDDPTWPEQYTHWYSNQQQAISAQVLLLCRQPLTSAALRNPRAALCNMHQRKHNQPCGKYTDALAHIAQHELAQNLAQTVSNPSLLAWSRPGLNLISDLGKLLALYTHLDLNHTSKIPPPAQKNTWAIRFYESHTAHWQQRIASLLFEFTQFLRTHWQ